MHTKKHSPGVAACGSGTDWSSCRRSLDSLFPRIQTDVARQPPIHLSIHLSSAAADHSIIQRSTSVYSSQSRITVHLSRPVNVVRARQSHRRQSHVVGVDRMGGHKQWTAWPEWPSPGVSTAGKISHSLRGGRARGTLRRQRDAIWGASCHRLAGQQTILRPTRYLRNSSALEWAPNGFLAWPTRNDSSLAVAATAAADEDALIPRTLWCQRYGDLMRWAAS